MDSSKVHDGRVHRKYSAINGLKSDVFHNYKSASLKSGLYTSNTKKLLEVDEIIDSISSVLKESSDSDEKRLLQISEPQHYLICRKPNG